MNKFVQPGKHKVVSGSVVNPVNSGLKLCVNFCSQTGNFEEKLDKEFTKKWSRVRQDYKMAYATAQNNFKLGCLVDSAVASDVWVVNLVVKNKEEKLDVVGLEVAFKNLSKMAKSEQASVHMAVETMGADPKVADLAKKYLLEEGVNLYVYESKVQE